MAKKTTKSAKTTKSTTASLKVTKKAKAADAAPKPRGRKLGDLHFKWVKSPKEEWPSALECKIMDACEAVADGTSGDVTAYALKHGLMDLTKQIPNKVVTHVMKKLEVAGIIKRTDDAAKPAKVAKTAKATKKADAPVAKKTAKKAAKKAAKRIVMDTPATASEPVAAQA